jgi:hypothetical protein
MNPTSLVWLKGDDDPFSIDAPADAVADALVQGRDDATELVQFRTPEGRALFVDPHQARAVLEARADAASERRCGFAVMEEGGSC